MNKGLLLLSQKDKYRYTKTWFYCSDIYKLLLNYIDINKKNTVLEIGCFEGLSSVYFADNILKHSESTLTCVDPFLNVDNNDHKEFLQNNEEKNFDHNIKVCKNSNKINVHKITSDEFFKNNTNTFNFIYIDGCHEPDFIMRDMINSFNVLENDGIMWMDDYLGGDQKTIKNTMDTFLKDYEGRYELIHKSYQLAIKKN